MNTYDKFIVWLDRRHIVSVRSFTIYATVWMTWEATRQAWLFVAFSQFDGMGTAAIVAAIMAPISALQAIVFQQYMSEKNRDISTR